MEQLTDKQEKILTVIKKFIAENGYAPTIRELCNLCGLSSTATMFVHLKNLTNKGYIKQTENKFRTIELNVPNEYSKNNDSVVEVPLLGKVAAGNPIEAIENPDNYFSLPKELIPQNNEVFTLEVNGESMINVGIFDGITILVNICNLLALNVWAILIFSLSVAINPFNNSKTVTINEIDTPNCYYCRHSCTYPNYNYRT